MSDKIAIISCVAAVISVTCLLIMTIYQLPRKIVDTFKVEIFRLFYSEPTVSIFQWYRKTSNSGTSLRFSDIKGFFPVYLRTQYCQSFFAVAIVEIESELGQEKYLKGINYDESLSTCRSKVFQFIDNHQKEFKAAIQGEDFYSVRRLVFTYYEELCHALDDTVC